MPNVHVRDVPPETLEVLRASAKRRGRSLNTEIVEALVGHAEKQRRAESFRAQLREGHRRWKRWFPDGYPPGLEPETVIRRHRDGA